jgi:tRNA dimethylallyltransferase
LNDKLKLIVIAGPTAVGKTDLAIKLALELGCEIISADSRQLYREMDIGTAKPGPEQLKQVTHHFISCKSIHDYYSAGRFEVDVINMLDRYNGETIIMVGGSGLYIKAVCDGIDEMPDPDLALRQIIQKRIEEEDLAKLTDELKKLDIDSWRSIDLRNPSRVVRALEVIHQTGRKYSEFKNSKKKERNFDILKIGLDIPREELFNKINARVDAMIDQGLLNEVKSLKAWKNETALQTVGYSEFFDYLDGNYDFEEAVRLCKRNTRRYAKRQLTWFRKDKQMHWFLPDAYAPIKTLIDSFIRSSKTNSL